MRTRALAVDGAVEFVPDIHADDRGLFVSPFQQADFTAALGHPLFAVGQVSSSVSRAGVARGVHFTRTPPGGAKFVHCSRGRVLDLVVDLRVGSPTFGTWDAVELSGESFRAVYFPVGVGHAFAALEDDSMVCYLLSQEYAPQDELAVSLLDPQLALPLPVTDPLLSPRDVAAPTLAEARAAGILPEYRLCRELDAEFVHAAK